MYATNCTTSWMRALQSGAITFLVLALVLAGGGCGGAGSNAGGGDDGGGGNGGGGNGGDTTPPAAPGGLTAGAEEGMVALSWDAADDAATYRVYRATAATDGAVGSPLDTDLSATRYEDRAVEAGTTYYYRVTAVDEAGNESDGSSEVAGTPFARPTGLAGTSGDAQVELAWDEAAGADRYRVYRSTASTSGADGSPLAAGVAPPAYTDTTAENGTMYYYRVTAVNPEDEESSASNEVAKTPFSDPPDRP